MLCNLSPKFTAVIWFVILTVTVQICAQDSKTPTVSKGVYWSDEITGTEIHLAQTAGRNYRLTIVSKKEIKVTYYTEINSYKPVVKGLVPKEEFCKSVKHYEFEHNFSRTTIWMALEFTVDGKNAPALTRTFYDSIFEVVPNERFLNPLKNKKY